MRKKFDYFFTSIAPDIYVRFEEENYGLKQIKGILIPFFEGLIKAVEEDKRSILG